MPSKGNVDAGHAPCRAREGPANPTRASVPPQQTAAPTHRSQTTRQDTAPSPPARTQTLQIYGRVTTAGQDRLTPPRATEPPMCGMPRVVASASETPNVLTAAWCPLVLLCSRRAADSARSNHTRKRSGSTVQRRLERANRDSSEERRDREAWRLARATGSAAHGRRDGLVFVTFFWLEH